MIKELLLNKVTLTHTSFVYSQTLLQNLTLFSYTKVPLRFYIISVTSEEITIEVTFLV